MKIKELIKYTIRCLCSFFAFFYSYSTMLKVSMFKSILYTYWITSEFKFLGKKSLIRYPLVLKGGKYISIGENTGLGARGVLTAWDSHGKQKYIPVITIGNNCGIGEDFHITAINKIYIGNHVLMGKKITISDNAHGESNNDSLNLSPNKRSLYTKGPVIIEDGVWIGDKVTILSNVTIGKNSIIGANALVTKDIPSYCVAGGVPARIIKRII